jgi:receptor protein-tyrosine kinase
VLRNEVAADDVVKPTRLGRLWLAPAGGWTPPTTQALTEEALRGLLDEWRSRFDFVVLDSAPVLPVRDTLELARAADGVIFSVLRDQSCLPQLYSAWQRLEGLPRVKMLGVVFSGARMESYLSDYEQVLRPG